MKKIKIRQHYKKCFKSMGIPIDEQGNSANEYMIASNFTGDGKMIHVNVIYNKHADSTKLMVYFRYGFHKHDRHGTYALIDLINAYFMDVGTLSIDPSGEIITSAVLYNTSQVLDKEQLTVTLDRLIQSGLHFYDSIDQADSLNLDPKQFIEDFPIGFGKEGPQSKDTGPKDMGSEKDLSAMKSCFQKEGFPITRDGLERHIEKDKRYSLLFQSKFSIDSETELLIDAQSVPKVRAVALDISGFHKAKDENLNDINFLFNCLHRVQLKGRWVVSPINNQIYLRGCYILPSGSFNKIQFRSFLKKLIESCRILYPLVTNPACHGKDISEILGDYVKQHKADFDWLFKG